MRLGARRLATVFAVSSVLAALPLSRPAVAQGDTSHAVQRSVQEEPGENGEAVELPAVQARRSEPGEDFVQANAAYENGDHLTAIQLYLRLVERGRGSGAVHYNLGNAYLRNGQLGLAIASYLRARSLRPRDQDVEANLEFARTTTHDAIDPPSPSPALRTLFFWHFTLSRDELIRATVVLSGLLWAILAARLFRRRAESLRWASLVLAAALVCSAGSLTVRLLFPTRLAVIVPQEVDVHAATTGDSVVRFKLHAGTEVKVVGRRPEWLRIGLPDGEQGWIELSHVQTVTL